MLSCETFITSSQNFSGTKTYKIWGVCSSFTTRVHFLNKLLFKPLFFSRNWRQNNVICIFFRMLTPLSKLDLVRHMWDCKTSTSSCDSTWRNWSHSTHQHPPFGCQAFAKLNSHCKGGYILPHPYPSKIVFWNHINALNRQLGTDMSTYPHTNTGKEWKWSSGTC